MPSASDSRTHPTHVLVEAGEILRALKPSTLGTLLVIYSDDTQTQEEIGDAIGCARSTVSKYLRSLEDLTLAKKRAQQYTVTAAGEEIIGLIDRMVSQLGRDLFTVNWSEDDEKKAIARRLTPLHNSRRISSIFILDSLYERSGTIGLLGQPQAVQIEDVVQDVEARQAERGESTTTELVRQKLRRFTDAEVIEFDGREITLTEKGLEHGRMLHELADFLIDWEGTDAGSPAKSEEMSSSVDSPDNPSKTHTEQLDSVIALDVSGETESPPFPDRALPSHDLPTIIPAYYLRPMDGEDIGEDSQSRSQQSPVLPLTALTIGELIAQLSRLANEYSEDDKLEPYWTVKTESGLYPVYSAVPQRDFTAQGTDDQ